MDASLILVVIVVLVALAFDFINGFHDAANSIATIVATRVLTPHASAILLDPEYGLPASLVRSKDAGLLLSVLLASLAVTVTVPGAVVAGSQASKVYDPLAVVTRKSACPVWETRKVAPLLKPPITR